ncbi:MAG: diguanylate cyclase [Spirochaetia bacterium]|nr:diguanylate cyclase [Spirochaetia bacterium]
MASKDFNAEPEDDRAHVDLNVLESLVRAKADLPPFLQSKGFESTLLLMNAIADGVLAIDRSLNIVYCNQAVRTLLGYTRKELVGHSVSELVDGGSLGGRLCEQIISGEIIATDESLVRHRDRGQLHVIMTGFPVIGDGRVEGGIIVFKDITPSVMLNLTLKEREEILRGIFNILPSGIMLQNASGAIVRINQAAVGLLGLESIDYRGRQFPDEQWNVVDLRGRPILFEDAPFNQVIRTGRQVMDRIVHVQDKSADGRYVLVSSSPLRQEDEGTPMVVTTFTDIDRQFRIQRSLESAVSLNNQINGLLKDLLTEMGAGETMDTAVRGVVGLTNADFGLVGLFDPQTSVIRYEHSFGMQPPLVGLEVPLDKSPASQMYKERRAVAITDYPSHPLAVPEFVRRGAQVYMGAPILSDNELVGVIVVLRRTDSPFGQEEMDQIGALCPVLSAAIFKARYEQRLSELATKDTLTGLWNRRVFFDTLQKEINRAQRYGSPLSVLMLDLDFFKQVNDTHGHIAGDLTLKAMAATMRQSLRASDFAARTGGEEFMVILPDTPISGGLRTAEKLQAGIQAMVVDFEDRKISITVSIGCAQWREKESQDAFYARLDRLLYESKNAGRNRVSFDPETETKRARR